MIAKIGTFDFSSYVRVTAGDGLNPYGDPFVEPQFSDSAFGVGQPLASVKVSNRQQVWPLYLNDADTDQLHGLVIDLSRELAKSGLQVEWRTDGASASTFYTVEAARFEPAYDLRQTNHGWLAGVLRVWCNPPYGHTGTYRVVGTAQAAGRAQKIPVGSLAGDVDAAAILRVTAPPVGTQGADGRIVAAAALPNATYPAVWPAASIVALANATVTSAGAGDMQDSAYVRFTGAGYRSKIGVTLTPASQFHGGRHRVFAVARADYESGMELSATLEGVPFGATAIATNPRGLDLVDLGAFETSQDDPRGSLQLTVEAWHPQRPLLPPYWNSRTGLVTGQGVAPGINELIILPEDRVAVLRDIADRVIAEDPMDHSGIAAGAYGTVMLPGQYDAYGNAWASHWSVATNSLKQYNSGQNKGYAAASFGELSGAVLGHRPVRDMRVVAYSEPGLVSAATHTIAGLCKVIDEGQVAQASGAFAFGYLWSGPTPWISLHSYANGSTTLQASRSVAMATGPKVRLELITRGDTLAFSVNELQATAPAFASIGATVDGFDQPGRAMLLGNLTQRFLHMQVAESPRRPVAQSDEYTLGDTAYLSASGAASVVRTFTDQIGADIRLPADDSGAVLGLCFDVGPNTALATTAFEIRAQERFGLAR